MLSRIAHPVASLVDGACMLGGLVLLGCAATQLMGASPADLARANDQAAAGATAFAAECAKCHGQRGEGLAGAPPLLGHGALPEFPRNSGGSGDTGSSTLSSYRSRCRRDRRARRGATPSGTPRICTVLRARTCPSHMRVSSSRATTGPW